MDAKKTFLDDPLRMLRVLRFYSRFDSFELSKDIIDSIYSEETHIAYRDKVSSERAGSEILKIFDGNNVVDALKILLDSNLYRVIFDTPLMKEICNDGIHMNQQTEWHTHNLMNHTLSVVSVLSRWFESGNSMRLVVLFAAFLHDFGKMKNGIATPHPKKPNQMQYINHEKASCEMAEEILISIGVKKEIKRSILFLIKNHMIPHEAHRWADKWNKKKQVSKAPGRLVEELRGYDNPHLWECLFMHAEADSMSSNINNWNPLEYVKSYNFFKEYINHPVVVFTSEYGSLIKGDEIDKIRREIENKKQVNIKKDIIKYAIRHIKQMQYRLKIKMDFLNISDPEKYSKEYNKSKEQAFKMARGWIMNKYQDFLIT